MSNGAQWDPFPFQWDDAAKASARQAAVRYACEASILSRQSWGPWGFEMPPQDAQDVGELACVTAVCAFICWGSTPPGAGGLP